MKNILIQFGLVVLVTLGSMALGFGSAGNEGGEWVIVQGKDNNALVFFVPDEYLMTSQTLIQPASIVITNQNKQLVFQKSTSNLLLELNLERGIYHFNFSIGNYTNSQTLKWP